VTNATRRINRRRQLVPNFDFVAVGIGKEDIRFAGHKFPVIANRAASGANRGQRLTDVSRATEPKPEVYDAAGPASLARLALEDQNVPTARRLSLDEVVLFVDRDDPDDGLVEAQGTLWIANGERNVS